MKGRQLFLGLVQQYSKAGFRVCYFKYDCPLSTDHKEMEKLNISPIKVQPSDDDAAVWVQQTKALNNGESMIVAVDSLSPLLLTSSIATVLSAIKKITQTGRMLCH